MNHLCLLLICLSLISISDHSFARGKKSTSPRPTTAVDTNDRITALSLTSVIVTIYATHQSKEFKVTRTTKFSVNGRPSTLNDLTTGLDVVITTLPNDSTTAATVEAKTPPRWQTL